MSSKDFDIHSCFGDQIASKTQISKIVNFEAIQVISPRARCNDTLNRLHEDSYDSNKQAQKNKILTRIITR